MTVEGSPCANIQVINKSTSRSKPLSAETINKIVSTTLSVSKSPRTLLQSGLMKVKACLNCSILKIKNNFKISS